MFEKTKVKIRLRRQKRGLAPGRSRESPIPKGRSLEKLLERPQLKPFFDSGDGKKESKTISFRGLRCSEIGNEGGLASFLAGKGDRRVHSISRPSLFERSWRTYLFCGLATGKGRRTTPTRRLVHEQGKGRRTIIALLTSRGNKLAHPLHEGMGRDRGSKTSNIQKLELGGFARSCASFV